MIQQECFRANNRQEILGIAMKGIQRTGRLKMEISNAAIPENVFRVRKVAFMLNQSLRELDD